MVTASTIIGNRAVGAQRCHPLRLHRRYRKFDCHFCGTEQQAQTNHDVEKADAVRYKYVLPDGVVAKSQERAYTSSIWCSPKVEI
jgi:hypothetical protein